jgi:DNA-binding NarL/FixJ family response regulator
VSEITARVLIADGHPVTRLGLKALLLAANMRVAGECGGDEEVLRLAAEGRPDLVTLGLNLAEEVERIEVCQQIKALPHAPHVLVHAAYNFPETVSACFLAGADSYLHKNADLEELLGAIRRTASGERVWSPGGQVGEPRSAMYTTPTDAGLTSRELEVLGLKLHRRTNAEIARELHISLNTVKHHVTRIYKKLGKGRGDTLWP